jgi:methylated-DNA-[protein]-cysteine S-methyltransferase
MNKHRNEAEAIGRIETPLGAMRAAWRGGRLAALDFSPAPAGAAVLPAVAQLQTQIDDWFAGRRAAIDLPLAPCGTPFERLVWQAAAAIPRGTTLSYAGLAARNGRPSAARAVGAALGRNPRLLVVPCHRVVGHDGALRGYAGGVERKRALLAIETRSLEPAERACA